MWPQSRLNDLAQCGEAEIQASCTAAATDEDVVGSYVWSHLLDHAVEQGHGERRAFAHGGGDRGASDGGEQLVEGVNGAGPRSVKQFIEQIECVLGAEVP